MQRKHLMQPDPDARNLSPTEILWTIAVLVFVFLMLAH